MEVFDCYRKRFPFLSINLGQAANFQESENSNSITTYNRDINFPLKNSRRENYVKNKTYKKVFGHYHPFVRKLGRKLSYMLYVLLLYVSSGKSGTV